MALAAAQLLRHHLDLVAQVLLLRLQAVQHLLHLFPAAAHRPLDLREVARDLLVLLGLAQQAQRLLGQLHELVVGLGEGFLDLFDELGDRLVGLVELG